ncbi:MAG TPA: AI-2E family transporter [Desulfosalsimonadaceae bacterium]|nr:AI-2E family transporter [Desulfosalsimonadaceae bacterium]
MNDWQFEDYRLKTVIYILGILGIVILGFHAFGLLQKPFAILFDLFSPFILALILAYIISPLVDFIQLKLRLGRMAGTLLVFFLLLLIFFTVIAVMLPVILSQLVELVKTLQTTLPKLMAAIAKSAYVDIDPNLVRTIETKLRNTHIDYEQIVGSLPVLKKATSEGLSAVGQISMGLFQAVGAVIGFGAFLAFVAIFNFYLLLDKDRVQPFVINSIPLKYRKQAADILKKMDTALGGFLRGQLTVALMVGLMFALGLFLIGFLGFAALTKFSLLIGTAAGICGIIPYFGPIMGVTPALVIVLFSAGAWETKIIGFLLVTGIFIVIQAIEGMVLQPKILGKGAALHPIAVMLALILGSPLGITGMIAAVPAACIIRVLLVEFYFLPLQQSSSE